MRTRRIMKFGGSSLAGADEFKRVVEIIKSRLDLKPLLVVSALGAKGGQIKITDTLKGIAMSLLNGADPKKQVVKMLERHNGLINALDLKEEILEDVKNSFFSTMKEVENGAFVSRDEALDALMGFGEIFSSRIMAALLKREGLNYKAVDPADFSFITNDHFQDADIYVSSLEKIASKVIASRELMVFPGYTGVTEDGRRITLGRGGSDYTAAILGAALKRDVDIWTDVDGIYRMSPVFLPKQFRGVQHPETIPELSYDEAFQMASFGSRVLHRKTLRAVQKAVRKGKHIHLYIKNTFNPEHPGTKVTSYRRHAGEPKGITCLEGTQLLNLYPSTYEEGSGFMEKVEELKGLSKVLASQTWGRISIVFDHYNPVLSEIESEHSGHLSRDQVLVKIVGDGIGENPRVLSRIQNAVHWVENPEKYGMTLVHKTPQLLTDYTFEFLVKKRGVRQVLLALYKELFMSDIVTVGLLGMGTVGSGVMSYARDMYSTEKSGFRLNFPTALVRNPEKARDVDFPGVYTKNAEDILTDPLVDIVLEVMGGLEPARTYVLKALENGKNVVTANKALLAEHGPEIFEAAYKNQRNLGFEASVCAEIPIIDDFLKFPGLTDIQGLEGIVNGTSNFVLTRFMEGMPFDDAVKLAQEKGFAEADPFMDVSGADAAHKLAIVASILFNQPIDYNDIPMQGIEGFTLADREAFVRWGMTVKPLVIARVRDEYLDMYVCPALVSAGHPLSTVREENNALSLYLSGRGEPITKIGKGAGAIPTARSVVRDVLDVSRKTRAYMVDVPGFFKSKAGRVLSPPGSFESSWYVRFSVEDSPGVLGKISSVLGDFNLSIKRIIQEKEGDSPLAHVLFELKKAPRSSIDNAADLTTRFPFVKEYFSCMILK